MPKASSLIHWRSAPAELFTGCGRKVQFQTQRSVGSLRFEYVTCRVCRRAVRAYLLRQLAKMEEPTIQAKLYFAASK